MITLCRLLFNFSLKDSPNTIAFNLPLEGIDATGYKKMVVPMRFDSGEKHIVRLEVMNRFREKGEVPVSGINSKWQDFVVDVGKIPSLTDFKGMKGLKFYLDKWNVNSSKGKLYIGNVRFIK